MLIRLSFEREFLALYVFYGRRRHLDPNRVQNAVGKGWIMLRQSIWGGFVQMAVLYQYLQPVSQEEAS
jgi:hypothetical protein